MPLPTNARSEPGSGGKWVILANGARVRRSQAENLGAIEIGFASNYQYRKFLKEIKRSNSYKRNLNRAIYVQNKRGLTKGQKQQALIEFNRMEALLKLRRFQGVPKDYTTGSDGYKHMTQHLGFRLTNDGWTSDPESNR